MNLFVRRFMEKIFYDIFDKMPRLGPGSEEATLKALSKVTIPLNNARVLDIGCGTGAQTMVLARNIRGKITALDNYMPFLDQIKQKAKNEGILDRIEISCRDMNDLAFENSQFDLVWAEGSIYIIGFKKGLEETRKLLKKSGYAVFSDMNWIKTDPPAEVIEFFKSECPEMMDTAANIELIKNSGFELIDSFQLDKNSHMEPYYMPLESRLNLFRADYHNDPKVIKLINDFQHEINLYKEYSDYFSYNFYIMKKNDC
jgi:ubiquinone/menaquinone biosynthesis C-methylase UbiE